MKSSRPAKLSSRYVTVGRVAVCPSRFCEMKGEGETNVKNQAIREMILTIHFARLPSMLRA